MSPIKINIVTVNSGWVLQKIAERIHRELRKICVSSISHRPSPFVDANFYIDVQNCYFGPTSTFDIGWFTHVHEDNPENINHKWLTLDYIMHICTRYYEMFSKIYPTSKMKVAYQGEVSPAFSLKKPTLGIFQIGGFEGKGQGVMMSLGRRQCLNHYKTLFVGTGWEDVVSFYKSKNLDVQHITDESYENYPSHYDKIDFLLIPSMWEGGPMAVVEAYAKGIPIISSNVGVVGKDLEVDYMYEPGDIDALENILKSIMEKPMERRRKVLGLSWKKYAKTLLDVVEKGI